MATFILIDTMNLAFRVRHGMRAPDMHTTVGLAIHTIFNSVKKVWTQFDGSNCVFALEGRSWRKDYYAPYKAHRRDAAQQRTQEEKDDDQIFFQAMDDLIRFLTKKTMPACSGQPMQKLMT
jgi:5'-3' exonuclease